MRHRAHFALFLTLLPGGTVLARNGRPWLPGRSNGRPSASKKASSVVGTNSASATEKQIFDLLNLEREKAGLNHLQWDTHLMRAARKHSQLMADRRDLVHRFPDEPAIPQRLAAAGARFTVSAENVAEAESGEEAHMALMASPGHRANILDSRYNAAGVGVVARNGRLFVTQDFAWTAKPYTEAEFRDAFIAAFNRARKAEGIAAIDTRAGRGLHSIACSTRGDEPVPAAAGSDITEFVTFTLSDPEQLPQQLMPYARDEQLRRMDLGVCFRPDAKYGYANFWVVAAFGQ